MVSKYNEICKAYNCKAKIYSKMCGGLKGLGTPDIAIFFTGTMSHKMLRFAESSLKSTTKIARSRSGSASALKNILEGLTRA